MNIINRFAVPITQIAELLAYYSKNFSRIFCPGLPRSLFIFGQLLQHMHMMDQPECEWTENWLHNLVSIHVV